MGKTGVDISITKVKENVNLLERLDKKEFREAIQRPFAKYMDQVKIESERNIIRRTVPDFITKNGKSVRPSGKELYERQPSVAGKLTERSGRMRAGLLEGRNQIGTAWGNFGNKNIKTKQNVHKTLNGRMKTTPTEISAWWSAYVRSGSVTLIGFRKEHELQYKNEKKRVAFRYMWETGIRGSTRRYMQPTVDKTMGKLVPMMEHSMKRLKRKLGL